jgi:hypothetical protein
LSQHEVGNRVVAAPTILRSVAEKEAALERERDRALHARAERHAHDGVFVSENDEAWERLKPQALQPDGLGEYARENVLDGSNLTFGIELEVEGMNGNEIARVLYRAGLSRHAGVSAQSCQGRNSSRSQQRRSCTQPLRLRQKRASMRMW